MCGIAGFFSQADIDGLWRDLARAGGALTHRGPDADGTYFDRKAGVGMAHRRLSIIDLSEAGGQPMQSEDGRTVVAYNGEVYNFKDLRRQLADRGHQFRSQTDTEVVLCAYREWGTACFERFVGMFAIAIWDRKRRQLTLCRDRMGIKPFYYFFDGGTFLFGSELKALMAFKSFPRQIDDDALPLYLHYQYIPAPGTVFVHTRKLEPGTFLQFDGRDISIHKYWDALAAPTFPRAGTHLEEAHLVEELDRLITRAVAERLVSDVPLGALLSGGIDSSLVVAMMQKVTATPTRTFSIGFHHQSYDEAPWARKIAGHLGTEHTELKVGPAEALNAVQRLPDIYDEPFADSSAIPTLLVSRLTRSHVTVALSGDGGDEQFAGYVRYWMTQAMAGGARSVPRGARRLLAGLLQQLPTNWMAWCYEQCRRCLPRRLRVTNFAEKWQKLLMQLAAEGLPDLYRSAVAVWPNRELGELVGYPLPASRFESVFRETTGRSPMSRLMAVDQCTYLPDCLLTKVDRASMAVSLEVRVPLLDHRIVEFSRHVPDALKYRDGAGKYLLKAVLARYIPRNLFERPKMGFGVPIDQWLRQDLKELVLDFLSPARLAAEGRFNPALVDMKIREHMSGSANHHHRIWAVLMWQMWRQRWM